MTRTRRVLGITVVLAGLLGVPGRPALACTTVADPNENPQQLQARQVREADVVFIGTATRFEEVEEVTKDAAGNIVGRGGYTLWSFDVEQDVKGGAQDGVKVRDAYTSMIRSSCAVGFSAGKRYRVYAVVRDGALTTDITLGTSLATVAPTPAAPATPVPRRPTFTG
jgi:hypothetical protein